MSESDGSWWGGWLQSAKEKSAQAIDFVKKDLQEFSTTVQKDTVEVAETVKEQIKSGNATVATQKVKAGMHSFLGEISKVLVVDAEDKHSSRPAGVAPHIFDRAQAQLHAIQTDLGTYCSEPQGSKEKFQTWKQNFVLDKHKGDISELLVCKVEVRALYTQLVPSTVSHADFWQRYFYKIYQLHEDEERRAALMKRADVVQEQEDMGWDEEEDDWDNMGTTTALPAEAEPQTSTESDLSIPNSTSHMDKSAEIAPINDNVTEMKATKTEHEIIETVQSLEVSADCSDVNLTSIDNPDVKQPLQCSTQTATNVTTDSGVNLQSDTSTSPTDTLDSLSPLTDSSSRDLSLSKDSSVETLTIVSPASQLSPDLPEDKSCEIQLGGEAQCVVEHKPEDQRVGSPDSLSKEIKTRVKGDLVVVGSTGSSDRTTPSSDSKSKESLDGDDEWDDFDVEVTEEDLKLVQQAASHINLDDTQDDSQPTKKEEDWENWE